MSRPQGLQAIDSWNGTSMKDFNAEGGCRRDPLRPVVEQVDTPASRPDGAGDAQAYAGSNPAGATPTETRECENCGKQKPIEEMETVFARGHGETYQCIECRGGP